jgi:hypothetical protein
MCKFTIDYEGHPSVILEEAKKLIERDGGVLKTSETHAWFTVHTPVGRVDGVCELSESSGIGVTIVKKPFLVPCVVIKDRIIAAFAAAAKATREERK